MFSPKIKCSPSYKNLQNKRHNSPIELKEKMRKDYKQKIRSCRNILINQFREYGEESFQESLKDIYENVKKNVELDDDESDFLKAIQNDIVLEEYQWWLQEYEKFEQNQTDWSILESDDQVICPVCQKTNFLLEDCLLKCSKCRISIHTEKILIDIKDHIMSIVDRHSSSCEYVPQFVLISESNNQQIHLLCDHCRSMQLVI